MSTTASNIIKLAQSWVGKNEKDGSHKEIIDIYNSHKPLARNYAVTYTDWWCATFITALAIKCNATDIIPKECGCGEMIALCQKLGIWVEDENRVPKAGDIVFYDWQDNGVGDNKGWPDHVGIIEKVVGNTITVIEGNVNDAVGRRTFAVNAKGLRGYAVPKYAVETVSTPTSTTGEMYRVRKSWADEKSQIGAYTVLENAKKACKTGYYVFDSKGNVVYPEQKPAQTTTQTSSTATIELSVLRKGSKGEEVKTLQRLLVSMGYKIGTDPIDGDFGSQTEAGVRQYQKNNNLTVDGVVGKQTWNSILK